MYLSSEFPFYFSPLRVNSGRTLLDFVSTNHTENSNKRAVLEQSLESTLQEKGKR